MECNKSLLRTAINALYYSPMPEQTRSLRDLATLSAGVNPRALAKPHVVQEFPFIGIKDVNQSLTPVDELPRISAAALAVQRFRVRANDVLVTTRGTTIRAAVAGASHTGAIAGANLAIVRVSPALAPALLAAYLREPHTQEMLLRRTAGAVTPGLTIKVLGDLPIKVPPLERQKVLIEYLASASAYREAVMRALELRQLASESLIANELSPAQAAS